MLAIAAGAALANISHRPHGVAGWLELQVNGLTFDLLGLAPGPGRKAPPAAHVFGLPLDVTRFDLEAVWLVPGVHIAAGASLLPVVSAMAALAATLARHLPAKGVCWHPAQSWMDAGYYVRIIDAWRDGGMFPALGLVPLTPGAKGAIASSGLRFFIGQEVIVENHPGEEPCETLQRAVRVVDRLVAQGTVASPCRFSGPEGEELVARVDGEADIVTISRVL